MDCDKYLEWMSAALDGELTAAERRELDGHLAVCPQCAALFTALSGQSAALRGLDCRVPEGLKERILAALPAREAPVKKPKTIHWKRWAALAACVVLAICLGAIQPWQGTVYGGSTGNTSGEPSMDTLEPDTGVPQADPRNQEPAAHRDGVAQAAPADTRIFYSREPDGWEDIVGTASLQYVHLSGEEALAFMALLEEQGIPYTVEGDETFSGDCQLVPTEG